MAHFLPLRRTKICCILYRHVIVFFFSINWCRHRKQNLFPNPSRNHIPARRHQYGQGSREYPRRGHTRHTWCGHNDTFGKIMTMDTKTFLAVARLHYSSPSPCNVFRSAITCVHIVIVTSSSRHHTRILTVPVIVITPRDKGFGYQY